MQSTGTIFAVLNSCVIMWDKVNLVYSKGISNCHSGVKEVELVLS